MGSLNWLKRGMASTKTERWPELTKRDFQVETGGQTFKFAEILPATPSQILVLHLPGFAVDGARNAEPMHVAMGQKYSTVALRGYNETHSRSALYSAIEHVLQTSGKGKRVILHGDSFGGGVVYELIGDTASRDFLKRNNIIGAILETPVLDKQHLTDRFRTRSDDTLLRRSQQMVGVKLNQSRVAEALREKTRGKIIEIPVRAVFAAKDYLVNNKRVITTLQAQAGNLSTKIMPSERVNWHAIADLDTTWKWEAEFIDLLPK